MLGGEEQKGRRENMRCQSGCMAKDLVKLIKAFGTTGRSISVGGGEAPTMRLMFMGFMCRHPIKHGQHRLHFNMFNMSSTNHGDSRPHVFCEIQRAFTACCLTELLLP
jgi:hypothetical protein